MGEAAAKEIRVNPVKPHDNIQNLSLVLFLMSQVPDFSKVRALVIGDVMLDRYWHGDTNRISPEAPVPVMRVTDDDYRLGGAANVAFNMAQLGCQVSVMGVVGKDEAAEELQRQIEAKQMQFLPQVSEGAQTIVKLRVMSRHQQLMRLDFENTKTSPAISASQLDLDVLQKHDVVILSDYAKGALSECAELISAIKQANLPVLVDPKGSNFTKYLGASIITPNMSEFEAVVGECESDADVESQGRDLMSQLQLEALLVTRSEKGVTLLQGADAPWHMPTQAKDVFDVTGAGDTVIATLAACVGAGESYQSAARWANIAAGIVVGKSGTSSVSISELQAANDQLHLSSRGVFTEAEVKQLVKTAQAQGETVVVTNGCFDILHAGHVTYLQEAAKLGDRLVVAVNSDETVRELKGPERPVNPVDNRMTVLSALACVDWVVRFDEMTPERLICELKPDFLVKGGDNDPANIPGNQCVWDAGGQVIALTYVDGVSTTQIVESIKQK